jgi:hypothetical protein
VLIRSSGEVKPLVRPGGALAISSPSGSVGRRVSREPDFPGKGFAADAGLARC